MGYHETTFSFEPTDSGDDGMERLRRFYVHNGYEVQADGGESKSLLIRGRRHASWWSSNMTRLHTELTIDRRDQRFRLQYRIEVTGQHLTDQDRQFWEREAGAAEKALRGEEIVDLRPREKERAREVTGEYRSTGLWAGAIVFVLLVSLGLVAEYFGFF